MPDEKGLVHPNAINCVCCLFVAGDGFALDHHLRPSVTLATILRDEGPYLLEWVAWNKLLGFGSIVLYDNESRDAGSWILPRLHQAGEIELREWPDKPGEPRQMPAFRDAITRCSTEWISFFDVDEFLVLHDAASIGDLLARFPAGCSALAFNQRFFGSSGQRIYEDRLVIERFTSTSPPDHPLCRWVKSIARTHRIRAMNDPHVVELDEGYYTDPTGQAREERMPSCSRTISFKVAQYNHYILKSQAEYLDKRSKGRVDVAANAPDRFNKYTDDFFKVHDVDTWIDTSATQQASRVHREIDRLFQICELLG